jgi:hypothetical protein
LAKQHGFRCTVLYAVDPDTGTIHSNQHNHLPGLDRLDDADLMIIATRFRSPDDKSMQAIDRYLHRGGPVIGLRTATHAFQFGGDSAWAKYSNGYNGAEKAWHGGFGRLVLGEQWVNHHGHHKHEGTRGRLAPAGQDSPITRGIESGDIWGSTDVYGVRLPMQEGITPLLFGESTARQGEYDESDLHFGMRPSDPATKGAKNEVKMPIAWTKIYQIPGGERGRSFTTTMGSSSDLTNEPLRRMIVNAAYWAVGLENEIPPGGCSAEVVGSYQPTPFGFRDDAYWREKGLVPRDFE